MDERDQNLVTELRKDGKATLTGIKRVTNIPISTLHEHFGKLACITRFVTLIDFVKVGFPVRRMYAADLKRALPDDLLNSPNINTLSQLSRGGDVFIDALFKTAAEADAFEEALERVAKHVQVIHVLTELKREAFLTDSKHWIFPE
ncbi:hypothetical protein HY493_00280 [Candidatus Woesearchaeota archaeon]|nr:hypothetical protein [Candidatus Woesearchaeota archaeon]